MASFKFEALLLLSLLLLLLVPMVQPRLHRVVFGLVRSIVIPTRSLQALRPPLSQPLQRIAMTYVVLKRQ